MTFLHPFIASDLRLPLGLLAIILAVLFVASLYSRHLSHNDLRRARGRPTKSTRQHVQTHAAHHGAALLVLLAGVALLLGVGVVLLEHGGGFTPPRGFHKSPPARPPVVYAGGAGTLTTADLSARVAAVEVAQDQLGTLACCGLTVVRLDEINRFARGETAQPLPLSGYRPWYYTTLGQNIGTTPDDEAASYNAHGAEPLSFWGPGGIPDATDAGHVTQIKGTGVSWDFYVDSGGGPAGLNDIVWRLSHNTPVGVIWAVHHDGDSAVNVAYTWDGGPFAYEHCLVAVQYTANFPGLGPAIKLWNSYGLRYGIGGYIWLPAAVVERHIQGAFTETPGPPIKGWLPAPGPTTPPPTATQRPAAAFYGVYVSLGSNLRKRPSGAILRGLPQGVRLRSLGAAQGAWLRVSEHGLPGWVPEARVRAVVPPRLTERKRERDA